MHIFDGLTYINNSSLALGFFDGLHLGHNVVLKNAIKIAKINNTKSTVIIFKEHPLNILTNSKVPLLLTLDEKLSMINEIGIDNVVLLDFRPYSTLKAKDYLENILIKYFSPIAITTGFNHTFGFNKEGSSEFLRQNAQKYNYKYFEVPPFVIKDNVVSCSVIRSRVLLGDFLFANELLGYKFFIKGNVIHGQHIARSLGFPSANINYEDEKIRIPFGVYFVKVYLNSKEYNGLLNYGFAPTYDNNQEIKTEVHILDFNDDIYGQEIKIAFVTKIRNQMKFESTEKLKFQLNRDKAFIEIYKHFIKSKI